MTSQNYRFSFANLEDATAIFNKIAPRTCLLARRGKYYFVLVNSLSLRNSVLTSLAQNNCVGVQPFVGTDLRTAALADRCIILNASRL